MKIFKTVMAALAISLLGTAAIAARDRYSTEGNTESKAVSVTRFSGVDVTLGIKVEVRIGNSPSAVVYAAPEVIPNVRIDQRGEMLNIGFREGYKFKRAPRVKVVLTTPVLNTVMASVGAKVECDTPMDIGKRSASFTASSGAEIEYTSLNCKDFEASTSSGAKIEVERLNASAVTATATSGSEIELSGKAESVSFNATSGAEIDAPSLSAYTGEVNASSGASITCRVDGKFSQTTSSGGSVKNRAD